jgi:hypothetical protein
MTDSTVLTDAATSVLSAWWTVPLLLWISALIVLRNMVLIDKRAVDRAAHQWAWWMIIVALLREHWVQHRLEAFGLELSDVRVLTHTAAIAGAATILLIGLYWRDDRLPNPRLPQYLYASTILVGILLWVISLPARKEHIAVEELENWRTGIYFTIYSLPTPAAETIVFLTALGLVLERSLGPRLLFGSVLLAAVIFSMLDHLTRFVSGFFLSFGAHNALTDARTGPANDLLFLPILALLVVSALPSIGTSVRIRLRRDPSSQAVKVLAPVWSRLTEAMPAYRLNQTHSLTSPAEQEHRMRIEIEDTIEAMNRYRRRDECWPSDPFGRANLLEKCIARHTNGQSPPDELYEGPPPWLQAEDQVLAMAAAWSELDSHTITSDNR